MIHSEQYYKEVIENYRKQVAQLKKENETKDNEVKILQKQNKQKDEVIHDLDKKDYRGFASDVGDTISNFIERLMTKELWKAGKVLKKMFSN